MLLANQPRGDLEPDVPALSVDPADDPTNLAPPLRGAGSVGMLEPIWERKAAVGDNTDPSISLGHGRGDGRGDHFLSELDVCHAAADQGRREMARPRSPA